MIDEDNLAGLGNPDYYTPPWEHLLEAERKKNGEILWLDPPF